MKKAISNILTGFWWPGRKTTTNNSENAQASDDSRDFDEIKINLDCDQISRIGKDMSESSKKLLNEELNMLSSLERLRKNKNELWIMALNNLKRLIPKQEQYYMKNGTGNTNPTIIEKDIRLIDEMIFFAEEFDNTILNISETEVIDLDEVDEIIQKEKLNNDFENYSKTNEEENIEKEYEQKTEKYTAKAKKSSIDVEEGILDLDDEEEIKDHIIETKGLKSKIEYLQTVTRLDPTKEYVITYSKEHLILLSKNKLSKTEPKEFTNIRQKDMVIAQILKPKCSLQKKNSIFPTSSNISFQDTIPTYAKIAANDSQNKNVLESSSSEEFQQQDIKHNEHLTAQIKRLQDKLDKEERIRNEQDERLRNAIRKKGEELGEGSLEYLKQVDARMRNDYEQRREKRCEKIRLKLEEMQRQKGSFNSRSTFSNNFKESIPTYETSKNEKVLESLTSHEKFQQKPDIIEKPGSSTENVESRFADDEENILEFSLEKLLEIKLGQKAKPIGITVLPKSKNICIALTNFHQVDIFLENGKKIKSILNIQDILGTYGRSFRRPTDMVALPEDNFAVRDDKGITMFDENGNFKKNLYTTPRNNIFGLAYDGQDCIMTISTSNFVYYPVVILIINFKTGQICQKFKNTNITSEKSKCRFLHFDSGNLFVGDLGLNRVYKMNFGNHKGT